MEDSKPQILLWTVPEFSYRVTIPAPIINEIRILAVEAFYSVPRGGVEIGGVFFGVREPDALHIRAVRPIPCQYSTGPSFTLSVNDQLALSGVIDQAHTDPDLAGMAPLGWYHSHTRSEIFLSPADLQLYREFFPERWQIAMVLRPANLQPTRAGFFFRDRMGGVKSDAPLQEYKLEPPDFGLTPVDGDLTPDEVTNSALAATVRKPDAAVPRADGIALVPKPEPVAPVRVPIPDPPPPVTVPATAFSGLDGTGVALAALTETPGPVPSPGTNGDPGARAEHQEPAQQPVKVVEQDDAPSLPAFLADAPSRKTRSSGWIWALIGILLLCGAGGAAVVKFGLLAKPSDLGLETYDINGAFLIRWDRESSVIRSATRATLEIQDGGENVDPIPLSRGELTVGGYGYMRRTGQVSVRMKVEGPTAAEEYSNFTGAQSLGSQQVPAPQTQAGLAQALADKEHLKTELINESMQSLELRRQVTDLRRQLAEERAKNTPQPNP